MHQNYCFALKINCMRTTEILLLPNAILLKSAIVLRNKVFFQVDKVSSPLDTLKKI